MSKDLHVALDERGQHTGTNFHSVKHTTMKTDATQVQVDLSLSRLVNLQNRGSGMSEVSEDGKAT